MLNNHTFYLTLIMRWQNIWEDTVTITPVILLLIVAVACAYYLWKIPIQYISARGKELPPKDSLELENDYRATLAQIVGGLLVLIGLAFTISNLQNSWKTFDLNRRSQEAERFNKAIELLGKKDSALSQMGGIFALESIAETDSDIYRLPVLNTFGAYIQDNAPWPEAVKQLSVAPTKTEQPIDDSAKPVPTATPDQQPQETSRLIQETLTFIGKSEHIDSEGDSFTIDLSHTNLRHADMANGHYEHVNFRGIYAFSARFTGAYLERADFQRANSPNVPYLKCTDFNQAHLEGTKFAQANLQKAHFYKAILKGTDFTGADLSETYFDYADLREASGITQAQIDSAKIDDNTKLPPGIMPTDKAKASKNSINCNQ